MAENRDDKIVYATYAISASANFNIRHGMPGNGQKKKTRQVKYRERDEERKTATR